MPQQIIQDRYIDQNKLQALLARKFPHDQYSLTWKLNRWILVVPKVLTDAEIERIELDIPFPYSMDGVSGDQTRTWP